MNISAQHSDDIEHHNERTGYPHSRMEGGRRQMRFIRRLMSKLRGGNIMDKRYSNISCGSSRTSTVDSMLTDDDVVPSMASQTPLVDAQFGPNIDSRYGGQYLTPEQLPEFCNQLHHLIEVIRNIQSYAKVTGEYPSELERRLEEEARELAALAAEARNACDVVARARLQRRAVRAQKKQLVAHLANLRETQKRELENSVRLADRKLYLKWEEVKESDDPAALENLLDEVRTKQRAMENLVRLVECRHSALVRNPGPVSPLPPLVAQDNSDGQSNATGKKRFDGSKRSFKRKRTAREPRSVPLSGEPSRHDPQQDTDSTARYSVNSAGAVALPSLELPSRGSFRDILFFSIN